MSQLQAVERKILGEQVALQIAAMIADGRACDAEDIASLWAIIGRGGSMLSADPRGYSQVDSDFHLAVAHCSHNEFLPRLLMDIRGLLVEWIAKSQALPGLLNSTHQQHKRIFKSVAERDSQSARKEMKTHLETVHRAYTGIEKLGKPGRNHCIGSSFPALCI